MQNSEVTYCHSNPFNKWKTFTPRQACPVALLKQGRGYLKAKEFVCNDFMRTFSINGAVIIDSGDILVFVQPSALPLMSGGQRLPARICHLYLWVVKL